MKKKRIAFMGLLILIIIGVCGCNMNIMSIKKSKIIKYLEKKYDDSFEYVGEGGGAGSEFTTYVDYYFVKRTGDTEEFKVRVLGDDMSRISDSYFSVLYKEEVKEYLFDLVSEIYGEDIISIPELGSIYLGKGQTSFSTVPEYLQYGVLQMDIIVPISLIESKDSMIEELRQRFATDKVDPRGTIYYLSDDIFPEVTESNCGDYLKDPHLVVYGRFNMNTGGDFNYLNWREKE